MRTFTAIALPLLAAASSFALTSCTQLTGGSAPTRITNTELVALKALDPLPSSRPVKIEAKFHDGTQVIAAPSIVSSDGQLAAIELITDASYPTRYTLAKPNPEGTAAGVTPATPVNFSEAPTGLSLKCTPQIRGAFIELTGSVIFSWQEDKTTNTAATGEGIGTVTSDDGRITLSKNLHQMPVFGSRTTPFFIRALPGKTYTLSVRGQKGMIRITLTPTLLAPHRGEIAAAAPLAANLLAAR